MTDDKSADSARQHAMLKRALERHSNGIYAAERDFIHSLTDWTAAGRTLTEEQLQAFRKIIYRTGRRRGGPMTGEENAV